MTVRKQMLLILICFSVLPVMIMTTVHLATSISTIENLHINRLNAITRTAAAAFGEIVGLRKNEVITISSDNIFRDYIDTLASKGKKSIETKSKIQLINEYLKTHIDSTAPFDDAVFLDENGIVIIASNDANIGKNLSDNDYFVQAKNNREINNVLISKIHKSLIYPDNPDKNCLALSQSFFNDNNVFLGTLVIFVNAYIIADFTRNISFGETGLSFIIDSDNYILYHPEARFYNSYTSSPQLSNLSERWKANELPASGLIHGDMGGQRRIYYYEIMSDIGLTLILRQDYDEFSADRTLTIIYTLISIGITLILAIFMGLQFSNKFTKPILMLKNAFSSADKLGRYVICELPVKNELGDMANSYNSMILKLEKQYELLKDEKEKNEFIAKHDKLTGLLNRSALEQELSILLDGKHSFGVFFIDMDNFKEINDKYGHATGDTLLQMLAKRFTQSEAKFDNCVRIGGDEFILTRSGAIPEIKNCAEILIKELQKPYLINGLSLYSSACIGISMYPFDAVSVDKLVANADIAMYEAKADGKNTFRIYNNDMRTDKDNHATK